MKVLYPLLGALAFTMLLAPAGAIVPSSCTDGAAVSTIDFRFTPSCLRVSPGTTVVWTNDGAFPHQVVSNEPALVANLAGGPCFLSEVYARGGSVSVTFDLVAGAPVVDGRDCNLSADAAAKLAGEVRIPYKCRIHPSMTGAIVIAG